MYVELLRNFSLFSIKHNPEQYSVSSYLIDGMFAGKARVAKAVAKTIGAKFLTTPSKRVAPLRRYFLNSTLLKHFYGLNKYILSHQIKLIIQTTPVVCDK